MGKSFGFGERLKAARLAKGLSGTDLGKGAGENGKDASKASVSDWENDRHYPKADQLRVICLKLNISVDDLLFGDIKAEANMMQAQSAIQALTPEQREALLAKMLGPIADNGRVSEFIDAAPPHELDSNFGGLDVGTKLRAQKQLKAPTSKYTLRRKKGQ